MKMIICLLALPLLAACMAPNLLAGNKGERRGLYVRITLGENQTGKVLEYTGAEMLANGNIRYDANIDNMPRTITYLFDVPHNSITVLIEGGAAPLQYMVRLSGPDGRQTADYIISSGGAEIGRAIGTTIGSNVLIQLSRGAGYDALSMDVLLTLPSEFSIVRPQDLFGTTKDAGDGGEASKIGKFFGKLLALLSGGAKYTHDCSTTTTGAISTCATMCESAPNQPGGCACSMCGQMCCAGGCTQSSGSSTRNCTATVSVGK